jgi:hypothetical protein
MNINFQRKVDRIIGAIICRILTLFSRRKSVASSTLKADKILIILLSEMGSLVMAYPMFQRLKRKYPGAELHGLVFQKNKEVLDLLEVTAEQNVLTINDASMRTFVGDSIRVIRQLRQLKFDIVIDCELFARISSIFSFISGAAQQYLFFSQRRRYPGGIPCPHPGRALSRRFYESPGAVQSLPAYVPTISNPGGGDRITHDPQGQNFAGNQNAKGPCD